MLPGKTDVTEVYTSDVFLNAQDSLFDTLTAIFLSYLVHGTVSLQILCCAFLPLFKGSVKNPGIFDSYRAIAGASQLLKLFEYVILLVWGDVLGSDSMQFGFKSRVSTTQCTWLVNEVTSYFMRRGTAVTACLLDCSKAFDKCRFDKLFDKFMAKGLPQWWSVYLSLCMKSRKDGSNLEERNHHHSGSQIVPGKGKFWSERSACAALGCWHKRRWPLF